MFIQWQPRSRHSKRRRLPSTCIMHAYTFLLFPSFSSITKRKGPCAGKPRLSTVFAFALRKQKAKKEDVVVAYGAGQFGSTMKGKRAAPVKKLRKFLRRYVTVVPVDEYRTSRVCSKHNEEHRERTGLGEEEDEGGGTISVAEADLIHIRAQRNANGDKGPSLHPVLFCNKCHTVWNRDVNAARKIAWIFWWLRVHSGGRPPGFRR
ncbi:hypothetical protein V1505DRAFT_363489 [Lipomyces doorenjongii]